MSYSWSFWLLLNSLVLREGRGQARATDERRSGVTEARALYKGESGGRMEIARIPGSREAMGRKMVGTRATGRVVGPGR